MSRPANPPRLYLRERKGRNPIWVVLDAGDEISTGCSARDREGAERALARYIARKHKPRIGISDQRALPIADVITYYLREKDPGEKSINDRVRKAFDDLSINVERLLEWWGDKVLSEVKRSNCRAYVEFRQGQPNLESRDSTARVCIDRAAGARGFGVSDCRLSRRIHPQCRAGCQSATQAATAKALAYPHRGRVAPVGLPGMAI
jgi:hypothetical protein